MTGILNVLLGSAPSFVPTTTAYTSGSGSITIPVGATTMVLEAWGSGGMYFTSPGIGYSGGSGGYSRSSYSVTGSSGKTVAYTAGAPVTANGASGNASTLSSGTFTITTMTAGGGSGGGSGGGNGGGGTASGGNQANTSGNAGSGPNQNNVGGAALTGVYGGPYGAGGSYNGTVSPGGGGVVVHFS